MHDVPQGDYRYSYALLWIWALDGVDGQHHAPAILPQWERPSIHFKGGCVGPRAGLERCGNSRPPPGFDRWIIHPVAVCYTDWALLAHFGCGCFVSKETAPHPPKHLHVLYRLWIMIGYSARVCSCVSVFDGRDCSCGTPLRHDSFVMGSEAPILPKFLQLLQVERLPCVRLG
jgi:hypothetical protein